MTWTCSYCGQPNLMERYTCSKCGRGRGRMRFRIKRIRYVSRRK